MAYKYVHLLMLKLSQLFQVALHFLFWKSAIRNLLHYIKNKQFKTREKIFKSQVRATNWFLIWFRARDVRADYNMLRKIRSRYNLYKLAPYFMECVADGPVSHTTKIFQPLNPLPHFPLFLLFLSMKNLQTASHFNFCY